MDDLSVNVLFGTTFPDASNKQILKESTLSVPVVRLFAITIFTFLYVAKATSFVHTSLLDAYDHPNNDGLQYPII